MVNKRQDKNRTVLKKGETQRGNGTYDFRWTDPFGKRHSVYAPTLAELRDKENEILRDSLDEIKADGRYLTVDELYARWCELKRGLQDNTFKNYKYMYETYVKPSKISRYKVVDVKKSDIKAFYNNLYDDQRLKITTLDNIQTVLHEVFAIALDDELIRKNPTDKALQELKKAHKGDSEKRQSLTIKQEQILLDYLKRTPQYNHWYPIFQVMVATGMRVGEATGLRWCDIDLEDEIIDINHTLVYFSHEKKGGCYFAVHPIPKTKAGIRKIPMQPCVKGAFIMEKARQEELGLSCKSKIDGYTDFIFINRNEEVQHNGTLNKAIRRIIRDCNDEILLKNPDADSSELLPHFSCHSLRHTFTTRLCEADVNPKTIMYLLGHSSIEVTMDIYADCTKEMAYKALDTIQDFYATYAKPYAKQNNDGVELCREA